MTGRISPLLAPAPVSGSEWAITANAHIEPRFEFWLCDQGDLYEPDRSPEVILSSRNRSGLHQDIVSHLRRMGV